MRHIIPKICFQFITLQIVKEKERDTPELFRHTFMFWHVPVFGLDSEFRAIVFLSLSLRLVPLHRFTCCLSAIRASFTSCPTTWWCRKHLENPVTKFLTLYNWKAHYSPPLDPVLIHINKLHILIEYLFRAISIVISLFWKNKGSLWDHLAVCVSVSPLSLLDNGSTNTFLQQWIHSQRVYLDVAQQRPFSWLHYFDCHATLHSIGVGRSVLYAVSNT
jgi:hypothetical protein